MTVNTASGTQVFIGSAAGMPATLTAYKALTWVEVGEVEDGGEFGDESATVTFTALKDARTRGMKGPRDAGSLALVVGDDMNDVGQIALIAAEASALNFPFKVVLNDAITVGGTDSQHYFYGLVMSKRRNLGNASNVVKRHFTIKINSAEMEVDPT